MIDIKLGRQGIRVFFLLVMLPICGSASGDDKLERLMVSANGRGLVTEDGKPFFWLADTAWELFHRLNREEANQYLEHRAAQGYTVIQTVALAELDGLNTPNAYGHRPLIDNDPTRPDIKQNEDDYWDHVDFIVRRANQLGMRIGLLPTWGDKWHAGSGIGPVVFNEGNAYAFGSWLGQRYQHDGVIWIVGGDKFVANDLQRRIIEAMARGLKAGDQGRHLITFHPIGQYSSAIWFHDADWLDFNMIQTGHTRDRDNYNSILAEHHRWPVKPVLDGEPGYENIPHAFQESNGRLGAIHVRRFCYWALFSGAFGHTYGANEVWQMWAPGRDPMIGAQIQWNEAIQLPGGAQMKYARQLIESGDFFDRLPDPSLVQPPNTSGADYIAACRASDASYALFYFPSGKPATLRTYLLAGPKLSATWYNPRNGERQEGESIEVAPWKTTEYRPPQPDRDWVLILRSHN